MMIVRLSGHPLVQDSLSGRALHSRGGLVSLSDYFFLPKNHAPEGFIPFGLRLIFLFFKILKPTIKQQYGLGLRLIG